MGEVIDYCLNAVAWLLGFFYELPVVGNSYGLAIMLLTTTVMIVLMPLTLKATKSTIKMAELQPEIKKLQKKYKGKKNVDKQKVNAETMELYKKHGVNPVGGCLPMLAQMPVIFTLFQILRGLTRRTSEQPFYALSERARQAENVVSLEGNTFAPRYLDENSLLFERLTHSSTMKFGPFDLAVEAWDLVTTDYFKSLPYVALILFVVATSYYQQKQIQARRGKNEKPTQQQQTQQQILRFLPLMTGAWSFIFPAGLVVYWATANVFRIGQQGYITRSLYKGGTISALSGDDDDDDDDDDEAEDAVLEVAEASKKVSSKNSSKASKTKLSKADRAAERREAWEQLRKEKSAAQKKKANSKSTTSKRVTPRGTKPKPKKSKK